MSVIECDQLNRCDWARQVVAMLREVVTSLRRGVVTSPDRHLARKARNILLAIDPLQMARESPNAIEVTDWVDCDPVEREIEDSDGIVTRTTITEKIVTRPVDLYDEIPSELFDLGRLCEQGLPLLNTPSPNDASQIAGFVDDLATWAGMEVDQEPDKAVVGAPDNGDRRSESPEDPGTVDLSKRQGQQIKDAVNEAVGELIQSRNDSNQGTTKRSKTGEQLWRRAQQWMIDLWDKGKLPSTLRGAAQDRLNKDGFTYNTVRRAAHSSERLRSHFGLPDAGRQAPFDSGQLLDELSGTLARKFGTLPAATRQAIEDKWKLGDKQKALELVKTLASDPEAGSTGDVSLIEEADQDRRTE